MNKLLFLFLTLILVNACNTTQKLSAVDVDRTLTPSTVLVNFPVYQSKKVLWGGIIVNSQNLKKNTLLEVLAYPLDFNDEPNTQKTPLGRFLIEYPEYLETVKYAPGRLITVVGPLLEIRKSIIGQAQFEFPVVFSEQLHLWPTADQESDTQIYFGMGISITK